MAHPLEPLAHVGFLRRLFHQLALSLPLVLVEEARVDVFVTVDLKAFAFTQVVLPAPFVDHYDFLVWNSFFVLAQRLCQVDPDTETLFLACLCVDLPNVDACSVVIGKGARILPHATLLKGRKVKLYGTLSQALLDAFSETLLE